MRHGPSPYVDQSSSIPVPNNGRLEPQASGPTDVRLSVLKYAPYSCRIRRDLRRSSYMIDRTPTFDLALTRYIDCGTSTSQTGSSQLCLYLDRGGYSEGGGSCWARRQTVVIKLSVHHEYVTPVSESCSHTTPVPQCALRTPHRDKYRIQRTGYINRIRSFPFATGVSKARGYRRRRPRARDTSKVRLQNYTRV